VRVPRFTGVEAHAFTRGKQRGSNARFSTGFKPRLKPNHDHASSPPPEGGGFHRHVPAAVLRGDRERKGSLRRSRKVKTLRVQSSLRTRCRVDAVDRQHVSRIAAQRESPAIHGGVA
jgi:hypothetical protein